jgi:hypothetical protein
MSACKRLPEMAARMGLVVKPARGAPAVVNRLVLEAGQGFRGGLR